MKKNQFLSILMLLFTSSLLSAKPVLFPTPAKLEWREGSFTINSNTKIVLEDGISKSNFNFLEQHIQLATGLTLAMGDIVTKNTVSFQSKTELPEEGYKLIVLPTKVQVLASTDAGFFYGIQTLAQLIENKKVPAVNISDQPRFGWRGMHLDVSRHFFPKKFIKRYIDLMALYKFNVFHWHLTDNDGWRIESKKYPKLTEVGAWRKTVGRPGNQALGLNTDDGNPYGGFYTQSDIKEIIAYGLARNVDILPEIDVPGHSAGIIQSYPEYGAATGSDVLNIGNDKTISFLEDIYTELAELFPFSYIHIGCDEVGLGAWRNNEDCQKRISDLNLGDEHGLHRWLVHHLQKFLATKDKKAIAWCEVLDCEVDKDTAVMAWRDNGGWIKAPKLGHEVVVTPSMQTYFNYQEDLNSNAPGHGGYRTIMKKVYNFDPVDDSLTAEQKKLVLGGQGCIWTEFIPLAKHVEYIAFPRTVALSEALWSPKDKKNWDSFEKRIDKHLTYLDRFNVQYRIAAPIYGERKFSFSKIGTIKLTNPNLRGIIRYTLDGTEPRMSSLSAKNGIKVHNDCVLKACVFLPNGHRSYMLSIPCVKRAAKKGLKLTGLKHGLIYRTYAPKGNAFTSIQNFVSLKEGSVQSLKMPSVDEATFTEFSGYIKMSEDNNYTFKSDVNVKFFVGHREVTDTQTLYLGKGYHPITVISQKGKGVKVNLTMCKGDDIFKKLSPSLLYHSKGQKNVWVTVTTDWQSHGKNSAVNLFDENNDTFFWASTSPKTGQQFTVTFSKSIMIKALRVETGKPNGGDSLQAGILEISEDGEHFTKAGDVTGGVAQCNPAIQIKSFRLKAIADQMNWIAIKNIEINSPDIY